MRALLLLLLATGLVPVAAAEDDCEWRYASVGPVEEHHVGVEAQTRACDEYASWEVAVAHREGRLAVEWYEDERGVGVAVWEPPRFVWWHEDTYGCLVVVYLFGAIEQPCPAGAPPGPPTPP